MKFSNKKKPGAIILGGHVQALGIIRTLGEFGVNSVVIENSNINISKHSKYCIKSFVINDNNLLSFILDLGIKGNYKGAIIFPTNDFHVKLLSQNKTDLEKCFLLSTDSWNTIEIFYNKRLTYSLAKKLDIPIPKSFFPDSSKELNKIDIKYPCIIKPAVMHSFYAKFKQKVFICNNFDELLLNYKKAVSCIPTNEVIVQEVISGTSEHLFSTCFLFDGERPINYFVGRRSRQHPPEFGNATTFAQIVNNDELIDASVKLLKSVNYKGVCEVEYKYDKCDNKYKLLEVNPRTWKWHRITKKAEINLLENYYNLLHGEKTQSQGLTKQASFKHLMADIPMWLVYNIKGIYKKYPKYPIQYAVWDKNDILPFFFELIYLPINIFRR